MAREAPQTPGPGYSAVINTASGTRDAEAITSSITLDLKRREVRLTRRSRCRRNKGYSVNGVAPRPDWFDTVIYHF